MDIVIGILLFVLGIMVYLIGYLLIPLIVASLAKLTKAQINLIVICNVIVVFILFQLWNPYLTTNIVMGIVSLFVGHSIMISNCLKTDEGNMKTDAIQTLHSVSKVAVKYCSRCGNAIDPTTKKCTGCGKQYFRGFSWKAALIVLAVLFVMSVVANIVLFFSNTELQRDIVNLERENSVLEAENQQLEDDVASLKKSKDTFYSFYERNHDKLELLDSWVVFVENDGTQLYHKYECNKFVGDDCWAHNIEYAEYLGYKPCPLCFD